MFSETNLVDTFICFVGGLTTVLLLAVISSRLLRLPLIGIWVGIVTVIMALGSSLMVTKIQTFVIDQSMKVDRFQRTIDDIVATIEELRNDEHA